MGTLSKLGHNKLITTNYPQASFFFFSFSVPPVAKSRPQLFSSYWFFEVKFLANMTFYVNN